MSLGKRLISTDAAGAADNTGNFSIITYTGTASAQSSNSLSSQSGTINFTPDLIWIKARNFASSHAIFDSVRGATQLLASNTQTKNLTTSDDGTLANTLTAFTSSGFSLGTDNGLYGVNASSKTYVAWAWKAGGSAVQNNDGSITGANCLVSANQAAGFSIVKYVGNSSGNQTIGHGLGVSPSLILFKKLDGTSDWPVYSSALTDASYRILLNSADAQDQDNNPFNSTAPTSSVFTVKSDAGNVNTNGESHIAYCFANVAGVQAIGSYNGNSSTPPSVTTNFFPRFVAVKQINGSNPWVVIDSVRAPSNPASARLRLNGTDVEYSASTEAINRSLTGFTVNSNWDGLNGDSKTYLYWAIA